jgi:hypothetical protein
VIDPPADDWHHWFYLHRAEEPSKVGVAARLGVSPAFFSQLLYKDRYRPRVRYGLASRIAAMWGQTTEYVEHYYARETWTR